MHVNGAPLVAIAPEIESAMMILRDVNAPWPRRVEASATVIYSEAAPFAYLLECLDVRGMPAEWASIALYKRTNRPQEGKGIEAFVLDRENWDKYLKENGFL